MIKKLKENKQLIITLAAIVVIAAAFGVYQLISYDGNKTDAQKYKAQADKYYESMDFRNALNFYNMALEAEPAYEEVYIILYEHYIEAGEKLSAWEVIQAGVENTDSDRVYELYEAADYPVEFPETFMNIFGNGFYSLLNEGYIIVFEEPIWRSELDVFINLNLQSSHGTIINDTFIISEIIKYNDLNFLKHFRNLETLSILNVGIGDFTTLAELTNLKCFTMYYYDKDIDFNLSLLENLTKLNFLSLGGVNVFEWSVLANFKELTTLQLENMKIPELSVIKELTKLERLSLSGIENMDTSWLVNLSELMELNLYDCGVIEDISLIAELPNLYYFFAHDTEVFNLMPLEEAGFENAISGYDDGSFIYFRHAQRQHEYFKRMNSEGSNIYYD